VVKQLYAKKIAENLKNRWVPEPRRLAAKEKPINPDKIDFKFTLDDFKKMAYHLSTTKQRITYL
jgi:hypothetical protein